MALVAGDERLIEAHNQAVKATLNHIEEKVLETRVWDSASKAKSVVAFIKEGATA
ncbi:MAG: relaxase domain-containing protein [Sphingomonadales bacterium]